MVQEKTPHPLVQGAPALIPGQGTRIPRAVLKIEDLHAMGPKTRGSQMRNEKEYLKLEKQEQKI